MWLLPLLTIPELFSYLRRKRLLSAPPDHPNKLKSLAVLSPFVRRFIY